MASLSQRTHGTSFGVEAIITESSLKAVSYTHLRAHETPEHLVCRLLLEKKNKKKRRLKFYFMKLKGLNNIKYNG